uniref:F-box associated domain-containing protein n=1 Tax=Chenopodium quinoa TaxID=63459 RepID=A0A803N4U6_CHEQI
MLGRRPVLYSIKYNPRPLFVEVSKNKVTTTTIPFDHCFTQLHMPKCIAATMSRMQSELKCFDLVTRKFYEMPLPSKITSFSPRLTILRGQLCMVTNFLDVFILEDNNDVKKSWITLFHHNSRECSCFNIYNMWGDYFDLACLQDEHNIILVLRNQTKLQEFMVYCDKNKEARRLEISGIPRGVYSWSIMEPWVELLIQFP